MKIRHAIKPAMIPVGNRNYSSKRTSALMYALSFLLPFLVSLYAAVSIHPFFWILVAILVLFGILDYLVFDAVLDRIIWKLFWGRFYKNENNYSDKTETDLLLKSYEQNPSKQNYEKIARYLNKS